MKGITNQSLDAKWLIYRIKLSEIKVKNR